MNKTMLVAQREFVENMRTKTFWIGILSFPLLILIAVFVAKVLEQSKDVRTYAVIDRSDGEWLSRAVEARAAATDLGTVIESISESDDDLEKARKFAAYLEALPDGHPIRDLVARLQAVVAGRSPLEVLASAQTLEGEGQRVMAAWYADVSRDPKKAAMLRETDMARYRLRAYDDLGDDPEKALNDKINAGDLFAYFVIGEDPVASAEGSTYVSNNRTDDALRNWFTRHTAEIVRERRIAELDLSAEEARSILHDFSFGRHRKVTETGDTEEWSSEEKAGGYAPIGFVYLLWIAVFTAANMLLTNTIEEKSNRLIEVLLSSVSPMQLMAGKVVGIGATGLTIVVAWIVSALVGAKAMPAIGDVDLASIIGDPLYLASFVGYFLAGYLLYAAFLVAIGSVCNSLKEAQGLMQPVFIVLVVPLLAMLPVVQDPNGTVAKILTYVPLFTPFLMMNRAAGPPPAWEYVASSVVIVVALVVAFWGAAKIFRIGVLMTGKPPRVREIWTWLRAPVGQVAVRRD